MDGNGLITVSVICSFLMLLAFIEEGSGFVLLEDYGGSVNLGSLSLNSVT